MDLREQPQPAAPQSGQEPGQDPGQEPGQEPMLYCPVCAVRLEARKCKLFCAACGYYMSCADYY